MTLSTNTVIPRIILQNIYDNISEYFVTTYVIYWHMFVLRNANIIN